MSKKFTELPNNPQLISVKRMFHPWEARFRIHSVKTPQTVD